MKKVASIIIVLFTIVATAQDQKENTRKSNYTPEQMAELQTKKMALQLDLDAGQQKELFKLNKAMAEKRKQQMEKRKAMREQGERLSKEERFEAMNAKLDEKLAIQEQMRKILNEEQYQQWKKMAAKKSKQRRSNLKKRRRYGQNRR